MTSFAKNRGFEAARAGELASRCPYKGKNPGSSELRRRWLEGYETGIRKQLKVNEEMRRRSRSPYVERRLAQIEQDKRGYEA